MKEIEEKQREVTAQLSAARNTQITSYEQNVEMGNRIEALEAQQKGLAFVGECVNKGYSLNDVNEALKNENSSVFKTFKRGITGGVNYSNGLMGERQQNSIQSALATVDEVNTKAKANKTGKPLPQSAAKNERPRNQQPMSNHQTQQYQHLPKQREPDKGQSNNGPKM